MNSLKSALFIISAINSLFTKLVVVKAEDPLYLDMETQNNCSAPEGFHVFLFYNKIHNTIHMNITIKPEYRHASIDLCLISEETEHSKERFSLTNDRYIILPKHDTMYPYEYELCPGKVYKITLENNNDGNDEVSFTCQIPDCFVKCKCEPAIMDFDAKPINNSALNLSWSINLTDKSPISIKQLTLTKLPNDVQNNDTTSSYWIYELDPNVENSEYKFNLEIETNHSCYDNRTMIYDPRMYDRGREIMSITYILFLTIFLISALAILVVCYFCIPKFLIIFGKISSRYRRRQRANIRNGPIWCQNVIYAHMESAQVNVRFEIERDRLRMVLLLAGGEFGEVFLAKLKDEFCNDSYVAVKTLKQNSSADNIKDFMNEINTLKMIDKHPNIIRLIGHSLLQEAPFLMIMEYIPSGDLKEYLRDIRDEWAIKTANGGFLGTYIPNMQSNPTTPTTPSSVFSNTDTVSTLICSEPSTPLSKSPYVKIEPILDSTELQNFALQIARGMSYVESLNITHRDLAARNVLINEFKTLKIADFGMSRKAHCTTYKHKKVPLRWVALEALTERTYNSKSDVWAYGVVLWEIGTLGALPYHGVQDTSLVAHLLQGGRLEKPTMCTEEFYNLMSNCWSTDPNQRPSFSEIVAQLSDVPKKIYVDFSVLNPLYVFPPDAE